MLVQKTLHVVIEPDQDLRETLNVFTTGNGFDPPASF